VRKTILTLCLMLGLAGTAGAQVYPPEVVGDCLIDVAGEAWMVPESYQAPWSVGLPDDLGYVVSWSIDPDTNEILLEMGPLVDAFDRVRGPALNWYQPSKTLTLDPENCHFHEAWIDNGVVKYELWVWQGGELRWHFGDWEIGHGNLWNFGLVHGVMAPSESGQKVAAGALHD